MRKILGKISAAASFIVSLPIRFYRKFLSPALPARCKYYPSCSAYALEAYKKHDVFMGTLLTVWRLLRCNPWSYGGVDKVPDKIYLGYFVPKNLKKRKEEKTEKGKSI